MVEGTSLLRKHMGISLYRGFESLALRQDTVLSTPKYSENTLPKHAFKPNCTTKHSDTHRLHRAKIRIELQPVLYVPILPIRTGGYTP